jgi:hypothetical protein
MDDAERIMQDKAALAGALASRPDAPATREEMAVAWATAGRTIPGALIALRMQEGQPRPTEEDQSGFACGGSYL